jgi:hypothetical protein
VSYHDRRAGAAQRPAAEEILARVAAAFVAGVSALASRLRPTLKSITSSSDQVLPAAVEVASRCASLTSSLSGIGGWIS